MLDCMATRTISPLNTVLMLCLITFWGSSFVVVKATLGEGLTPVAVATFRFLMAGGDLHRSSRSKQEQKP